MPNTDQLQPLFSSFQVQGKYQSAQVLKVGHIHETYVSTWSTGENSSCRYIHQKLNENIFRDIAALIKNIQIVTEHIQSKLDPGSIYRTLKLVPTQSGDFFLKTDNSEYWRTFEFLEGTKGYEACPSAEVAYQSGLVCGHFAQSVADLNPSQLAETIPNFINSVYRYDQFQEALKSDRVGRVADCEELINYALAQKGCASLLMDALRRNVVPLRVSHNDTKIDNILFDQDTEQGVCIVDLDTCMAGSPLFDYGDLVRTSALHAAEDEMDLSTIEVLDEFYEAVHDGFLTALGGVLSKDEISLLPKMPAMVSLTLGVRFLTDFLNGDTYFKIDRERHNYDRARAQFEITRQLQMR